MQSIKLTRPRTFLSLLFVFLFHFTSFGQTSTLTFTSNNPALGQSGGYTYCTAEGWIVKSNNYCGQVVSPAFTSNMNSSNIMFLGVSPSFTGRTTVYPMTAGNYVLYTASGGATPEAMLEFIIRSINNITYPVDITSVDIYHEHGSDMEFTFTGGSSYRGTELGSRVVTIPSGVATSVSLSGSGFYGFSTIRIIPTTNIIFGTNAFTFTDVDTGLPVEWAYFEASQDETAINLNWATQQEINTDYFDVQRKSPDDETFLTIGTLDAAGTSDELKSYQFADHLAPSGSLNYRIRQVDIDGKESFSKVEEIRATSAISFAPNPTTGLIDISASGQTWSGRLLNLHGKVVREIPSNQSQLNISDLPAGIYLIDLRNKEGQTFTKKIVKN